MSRVDQILLTGSAPIGEGALGDVVELHGAALSLFSTTERKEALRAAFQAVGNLWVTVFLPKRFTSYAEQFLGYNPNAAMSGRKFWVNRKVALAKSGRPVRVKYGAGAYSVADPQPTPFVFTGFMRERALTYARAEAGGAANNPYVKVMIPLGHALRSEYIDILRKLPPHELKRLAEECEKALKAAIEGKPQSHFAGPTQKPPPPRPASALPERQRPGGHERTRSAA